MIPRIEPGYLRTQDSLSKRDRQGGRRRRMPPPNESGVEPTDEGHALPDRDRESARLDLVA